MAAGQVLFERDGDAFRPTDHAMGPWSDGRLHGGAVGGLLAELAARRVGEHQTMATFRVELFGAVPGERLEVETVNTRAGDRLSMWDLSLRGAERVHARATAVLVALPHGGPDAACPVTRPGPEAGRTPPARVTESSPFFRGIEFRVVAGGIGRAGPTAVWTNVAHRWLDGGEPSGLARLIGAADTAYGYGLPIEGDDWLAMNLDIHANLVREPQGEWLLLDAKTEIGTAGVGVGHAEIADRVGRVGRVTQTVIVRPSRR